MPNIEGEPGEIIRIVSAGPSREDGGLTIWSSKWAYHGEDTMDAVGEILALLLLVFGIEAVIGVIVLIGLWLYGAVVGA